MPVQSIARTVRPAAVVALIVSGSLLVSAQEPSQGQGGFSFRTRGGSRHSQRHGDRRVRTRGDGTACRGLHRLRRRRASGGLAVRGRARAGEPGAGVDTSGSMAGEKMSAAQAAVSRFVVDLLGPRDQVFLYRFDSRPRLMQGWTDDRRAVVRSLGLVRPRAAPRSTKPSPKPCRSPRRDAPQEGARRDFRWERHGQRDHGRRAPSTHPRIRGHGVRDRHRRLGSGILVGAPQTMPCRAGGSIQLPWPQRPPAPTSRRAPGRGGQDRVNVEALRMITDDSGGRTEIIYSARDLDPATAGIASELSQQYFVGYVSTRPKDGRWHRIEVRVRNGSYMVRARKGYVAS